MSRIDSDNFSILEDDLRNGSRNGVIILEIIMVI